MKGFCISLDISKGSSFYQGFKSFEEPITKAKKIEHNFLCFFPSVTKTRIITRAMKSKYSMLRYITKYQHY